MFSIVIPLYNKELSIRRTITSVLDQSFDDFEIIVINDGSSDNSRYVVEAFQDKRIRLIDTENRGVSSARNRGIAEANFQWIVFLDADDIWQSFHLTTLSGMIQRFPEDRVFCTSFIRSTELPNTRKDYSIQIIEDYFKAAMQKSFFWTSVTCIHESVFKKIGCFPLDFSRGEDVELWNRIGREYRFIKSNLITATYNIDSENKLTQAKYNYRNSTLYSVHTRIKSFSSKTEKRYYLRILLHKQKDFFRSSHFGHAFKTMYRFFVLLSKPIQK